MPDIMNDPTPPPFFPKAKHFCQAIYPFHSFSPPTTPLPFVSPLSTLPFVSPLSTLP